MLFRMDAAEHSVEAVFAGRPEARAIYQLLVQACADFGPMRIEAKGTCIHLAAGRSAFAGVHPRKHGVLLTIRSRSPIDSPRVRKCDRPSATRAYNDLLLETPEAVDEELIGWLQAAYGVGFA
jgi:hypothetical protein